MESGRGGGKWWSNKKVEDGIRKSGRRMWMVKGERRGKSKGVVGLVCECACMGVCGCVQCVCVDAASPS